jgi:hypothetical protein
MSDDTVRSQAGDIVPLPRLFAAPLPGSDIPLMADSFGAPPKLFLFGSPPLSPGLAATGECASAVRASPMGVGVGVENCPVSAVVVAAGVDSGRGSLTRPWWTAVTASEPVRVPLAVCDPGASSACAADAIFGPVLALPAAAVLVGWLILGFGVLAEEPKGATIGPMFDSRLWLSSRGFGC